MSSYNAHFYLINFPLNRKNRKKNNNNGIYNKVHKGGELKPLFQHFP